MVKEDTLQIFMRKVFDVHCTLLWWHIFVITDNYVDMSNLYVVLSDLYVDWSDHYVDMSLIHLLENES